MSNLAAELSTEPGHVATLQLARRHFDRAESLARQQSARSVDEFYAAAVWSWTAHIETRHQSSHVALGHGSALKLYHDSVERLLREAQSHGRLNPRAGLVIEEHGQRRVIPIEYHGFVWQPEDFQELVVLGDYKNHSISRNQTTQGIGVPLVVVRRKPPKAEHETDFIVPSAAFTATAVLQPDGSALSFYDPLRTTRVEMAGEPMTMSRDLTAGIAYQLHYHGESWLDGFLSPNRPDKAAELIFMEPFQPDKIPLIFVHGLLSNPQAWADTLNELRASPEVIDRYQIWAFRYSTGAPFVRSAADLRAQLDKVRARFDPDASHAELRRTVVVGHSMGGLIAKLLVSSSGEDVWNAVAKIPLDSMVMDDNTRAALTQRLYFDPYPLVQRAVFIATPHHGSAVAGRAAGRIASSLVVQSEPAYEKIKRDNVGALQEAVSEGLPSSIDMLNPDQPFLDTIWKLRVGDCVTLHSIIGEGSPPFSLGNSDGIVEVESARHPRVASEVYVPASHTNILRHGKTVAELKRILRLHAEAPPPEWPRRPGS